MLECYHQIRIGVNMSKMEKVEIDEWDFIISNSKRINDKTRRKRFLQLLNDLKTEFLSMPAARKRHHHKEGGLLKHTFQVVSIALELYEKYKKHLPGITAESIYIVAVLHDLAKCKSYLYNHRYPADEPYPFNHNEEFKDEPDVWTIAKAEMYDLKLSYDEMMGIMQAHGGWSKINEPTNKLAVIIHCADIISSQIIRR